MTDRTIAGTLIPYDTEVWLGDWYEFAPGCCAGLRPSAVKFLVAHDHDRPAGVCTALEDGPDRLRAEFRVARTPLGDQALAEAAQGVRDGLSLGAYVDRSTPVRRGDHTVNRVTAIELYEGSLVTFPAFQSARVTEVREDQP